MKRKSLILFLVFTFLIASFPVNAATPYLTKEWSRHEGTTYEDAIDWTNYLELDDGYVIASLGRNGYATLRKISKDGKKIIWMNGVDRGLYFGDMHYYKNNIYVTGWDGANGTYMIKFDENGNELDRLIINPETDNDYAYGGESFLHENKVYFVYKSLDNDGLSDTPYGPEFIAEINLDTFKIETDPKDFYDYSNSELDYITGGKTELISEKLNHIYSETGYTTYISQQLITDKYKYYSGSIYNDDEEIGIIVKSDFENNIIWTYKPGKEVSSEFYDIAYLGNDTIAATSFTYNDDENSDEYLISEIKVLTGDGNVVENHSMKEELGVINGDVIVLNNISDGLLGQVVAYDYDTHSYQLYTIKYSIRPFDIEKEVKGKGEVVVNKNAKPGEEVEFNVTPAEGYIVKEVTIIDEYGNIILPDGNKFIMPSGDVKIIAEFVPKVVENPKMGISNIIGIGILGILAIALIYIVFRRYTRFGNLN